MRRNSIKLSTLLKYKKYAPLCLFLFTILLYINTLGHDFTQDDAIVIYKNSFTTQGVSGIPDLFSKDSFHGFFGENKTNLVSGGRYRPLTLCYFAILWEVIQNMPFAYHLSNILLYGTLVVLVFHFFQKLKPFKSKKDNLIWSWVGALIFSAHPIHTEVVANVKGLDEIWSLTFGILATLSVLFFVDQKKKQYLILASFCIVLGLLSKENAIAFLGIIPLTVLYFRKTSTSQKTFIATSLFISAALYFLIRNAAIGFSLGQEPLEMMNNPFIKMINGTYYPFTPSERWATIIFGLGKNVQLLFFPHPLTHDYYPRHFEVMTFLKPEVLLSLIMNLIIVAFAFIDFRRKSATSYAAFFYIGSVLLTSNIVFPIGTHLSERFLFMPSVAFSMIAAILFIKSLRRIGPNIISLIFLFVLLSFATKTITRNNVWQSDYRLFTTDVKISTNSAKVQNAAGGAILTRAAEIEDKVQQKEMRTQAEIHLKKALEIHPNYKNAHLLLGNAQFGLNEFDQAILSYEQALNVDPGYTIAHDNLILAYREGARFEGSQKGNIKKAIQYLYKVDVLQPGNYETISLLGIAHGNNGEHDKALDGFFYKSFKSST